jgi:methyl-accepting chemotaxis protein
MTSSPRSTIPRWRPRICSRPCRPRCRRNARKTLALIDQYYTSAKELAAVRADLLALQAKPNAAEADDAKSRMAALDAQSAALVGQMTPAAQELRTLASQIEEFANARGKEGAALLMTQMESIEQVGIGLAGAVTLMLIGAAIFLFLTIARPVRTLTGCMLQLADGKLDVILPGLNRKDEIGEIAGAVEAFKIKAVEKARREADEKAERDRQAASERDAALAKMADEFEATVGGIVEAAVAGNFSQRVALEGKSGLVLNVGTSINCLCDNIAKALDDLVRMLGALADCDLTQRITADYRGNFATLKTNANTTAERIGKTIAGIKRAAREVNNASAEISTSTTSLSQRTEEQAASLEETSASMEEMSVTVKKNAENAQQANQSAGKAHEVADRGGQVVAKAVAAMAQIEGSSRKISDIIGVIDEIARQTNLLALNAAVEAARAGDAGRGFAVVASEVRSLAQRASQAAKDIKDLITTSNSQVQNGVGLVNEAGSALAEILESIKEVAGVVAGIASASAEQATGIEQVNKALSQMDDVTQQNSALVEENAATAKTLEHQSSAMNEQVSVFRVDETAAADASGKAPSAPIRQAAGAAPKARGAAPRRAATETKAPPSSKRPQAAANRGPVGRMQTALASAIKSDPDWKEF